MKQNIDVELDKSGVMKVRESIFHFWVKTFDEPSVYGPDNNGRISMLYLKRNNSIVCSFDGEWDIETSDEDTQTALEILKQEYN